ncbi:hypothetical protein HFO12_22575 [Rhizobium leguminosarum]|uniref:Uncharacterized protein n=1 Tax=Rhizobium laguerreae TaxID=1076926 RepID=A0A6N9ZA94_9HYPH|nr:hypothetical protein [Rhizobium laguerreae]MBY5812113.1 hypothetical protein [Rhizobium leguminosarum]NEH90055.1 hypothetical protein [Rhizobium laguerreae]
MVRSGILLAGAILRSAIIVGGAILIRPSDFDRCLVISAEIYRRDQTATLDPREVEAQAARICSGNEPK